MLGYWSRFKDVSQVLGARRALALSPGWSLVRKYEAYIANIADFKMPSLPENGVVWSLFNEKHLPQLLKLNPAFNLKDARIRLRDGQRCLLGFIDGEVIYYRWDGAIYHAYLDLTVSCFPGDICAGDAFAHPKARGLGLHKDAIAQTVQWAKQNGYKRYLCFIAYWNEPSRHVWSKYVGSRKVGLVQYRPLARGVKHRLAGAVQWQEPGRIFFKSHG
jgi:GNAT superfamily N-acetyltransferase